MPRELNRFINTLIYKLFTCVVVVVKKRTTNRHSAYDYIKLDVLVSSVNAAVHRKIISINDTAILVCRIYNLTGVHRSTSYIIEYEGYERELIISIHHMRCCYSGYLGILLDNTAYNLGYCISANIEAVEVTGVTLIEVIASVDLACEGDLLILVHSITGSVRVRGNHLDTCRAALTEDHITEGDDRSLCLNSVGEAVVNTDVVYSAITYNVTET